MGGLEQQLLSRVVQMERPELEEQKSKLVEEVNYKSTSTRTCFVSTFEVKL